MLSLNCQIDLIKVYAYFSHGLYLCIYELTQFNYKFFKKLLIHFQVLTNGIEVKLQRNALSVIEPPTGHEEDNEIECDNRQWNSSGSIILLFSILVSIN